MSRFRKLNPAYYLLIKYVKNFRTESKERKSTLRLERRRFAKEQQVIQDKIVRELQLEWDALLERQKKEREELSEAQRKRHNSILRRVDDQRLQEREYAVWEHNMLSKIVRTARIAGLKGSKPREILRQVLRDISKTSG